VAALFFRRKNLWWVAEKMDIEGRVKRLREFAASTGQIEDSSALSLWSALGDGEAARRSVSTDNVFSAVSLPQPPQRRVDNKPASDVRKLTQQNLVLDAALREEKVKSEKLAQEVRSLKIALAKEKQGKELADKEAARLRRDLVAGKEALAAFAKQARADREHAAVMGTAS
jgi:hypothetical protein